VRRLIVMAVALAAVLVAGTAPANAQARDGSGGGGWVPAPSAPWAMPAGARCDFAITGVPIVDEVRKRVLATNPDGSPRSELWVGDLVIRITNTGTGAHYDADASGRAVITYAADGSQTWYVHGPVLVGFAAGGGNLPRGLYIIDGLYRLEISPTGYRTVTMVYGTTDDLCARVA
jgi:hypothetical protein